MITIDALGKDGASILPDLAGASPAGGFVTTGTKPCTELRCGDVLRGGNYWAVIAGMAHNAILGCVTVATIADSGEVARETFWAGESVEYRTDARIDPGTLCKLTDYHTGSALSRDDTLTPAAERRHAA
jgi:hypothetical protein